MPQLEFDLGDLNNRSPFAGRRLATCQTMVAHLNATGRITPIHLPMVEHLYGLCEAMENAGGRGASYALLAAQFDKTWERLATLPMPDTDDEVGAEEYDVVVLHAVAPPALESA